MQPYLQPAKLKCKFKSKLIYYGLSSLREDASEALMLQDWQVTSKNSIYSLTSFTFNRQPESRANCDYDSRSAPHAEPTHNERWRHVANWLLAGQIGDANKIVAQPLFLLTKGG